MRTLACIKKRTIDRGVVAQTDGMRGHGENIGQQVGPNAFLRGVDRLFCRYWHRLPRQLHPLPAGPLILAGNHLSGLDPLLIQASVDRPVAFMMAREYYQSMWYIRWGFDMVGAIPVNPGGANRQALKRAIEVVRAGNVLCIFPEGAANPPVSMARVLPGAALIAAETGAPIIPFFVSGVTPFDHQHMWPAFYRRGHAKVAWGAPIQCGLRQDERQEGQQQQRLDLRAVLLRDSEYIRQKIIELSDC